MIHPVMAARFWGVRGSVPVPGPSTIRYGGNTTCVSIEFSDGGMLILDAGTGIRLLGDALVGTDHDIALALTHAHWDHIQGFPFFGPLFEAGRTIYFAPHARARDLFDGLVQQMDGGTHFPIGLESLPANLTFMQERSFLARLRDIADVDRLRVNHPGETDGIRVRRDGHTIVFIPDNEIDPPYDPVVSFDDLVAFCRDADVLIHDAQYLESDLPAKRGWGHSTVPQVCELAAAAEVDHVILFHHDPSRTDDQLDEIHAMAIEQLSQLGVTITCSVASEGLAVNVGSCQRIRGLDSAN